MDARLEQLSDGLWELTLEAQPVFATLIGDHRRDDELGPVTDEEIAPFLRRLLELRDAARELPDNELADDDLLTRDLLVAEAEEGRVLLETGIFTTPIDPLMGAHSTLPRMASQTVIVAPDQAEMILERYRKVPDFFARVATQHRADLARGITPTATNATKVVAQIDAYLASPIATDPFAGTPVLFDWKEEAGWRDRLRTVVEESVRPAFAEYRRVIADEILPHGRGDDRPGLGHIPDGERRYAALARVFTTLDLSPEQIHAIGDEEATESLAEEFVTIGGDALGSDDHDRIIDMLRSDPALRYDTADEMVTHAETALARAWAAAGDWFGRMPEGPCRVVPIPPDQAPGQPPAYYLPPDPTGARPGTYFLNTHAPETRSRFDAESTAFHEAIPGHHFQLTLAQQLENLPEFRKHANATAYAEGWGLYAERLADEMGLYGSPLDRLGMVSADAWRAARLVVDTGIHHLGWSRQQGIDYFMKWTAVAPEVVAQEVDRYIGMPGQALAYKMGQRQFMAVRADARKRLGDRFDIRGFHDAVLTEGGVPLPVLGKLVDRWVESQG